MQTLPIRRKMLKLGCLPLCPPNTCSVKKNPQAQPDLPPVRHIPKAVHCAEAMAFYREGLKPWQRGLESLGRYRECSKMKLQIQK